MKVIEVQAFGGPEVLQLVEKDMPRPGPGEVLVKVGAIGVNPVETYIREGTYPILPALPYTPGGNAAGVIHVCGEGSTGWAAGDRVYTAATMSGAYGEYCLCKQNQIYALPDNMSFAQGAALGIPAATAYRALFIRGTGRKNERVLIHGASGSVGMAALQLASAAGMEVYGTAGTAKGLALIRQLGAVHAFNHRQDDYVAELATACGGFDLILEMLANVNLQNDLELLVPRGRVVIIGSRGRIEIDPRATMGKETDIRGLALANATVEELGQTHAGIAEAMASGVLQPVISAELPLAEAGQAHIRVLSSGNCGKIALVP